MESLQSIKQRIGGVENINQITKAMEVVAATKMRRSQEIALASRPYTFAALDLLATLLRLENVALPPLLQPRRITRTAFVVVTSDKGLAGAFNSAVLRAFAAYAKEHDVDLKSEDNTFIAVGQKAANYLHPRAHRTEEVFTKFGDYIEKEDIDPLSNLLINGYLEKRWDEVIVFSTNFRTALNQEATSQHVLPVEVNMLKESARALTPESGRYSDALKERQNMLIENDLQSAQEYIIEPSASAVIDSLAPHLVKMHIYHIILEANASEHAARRMAMKNASENAEELADNLTIEYNKSRQAAITREITEITAGAEALSGT